MTELAPTGLFRPLDPGDPERFRAERELDVLVPTYRRPVELAATLAGLAAQPVEGDGAGFGVVVSDQSPDAPVWHHPGVAGMVRVLRHRGHPVLLSRNLPRQGLAQQRHHLLGLSRARYVLYCDDDVWLEPGTVDRLLTAIRELGCGFVGNAPHGLSYADDVRPEQQRSYQEWDGPPRPERIEPHGPQWRRASVHAAANLLHITERLALAPDGWRAYRVAWIGACVLYDRVRLCAVGGYGFWPDVPTEHAGEDVAVQLRLLARYGGAGVLPSGAYHLECPTTVPDRSVECWQRLDEYAATAGG